jgi:hypothetical protein
MGFFLDMNHPRNRDFVGGLQRRTRWRRPKEAVCPPYARTWRELPAAQQDAFVARWLRTLPPTVFAMLKLGHAWAWCLAYTPWIFEWRDEFGRRLPVPPGRRLRKARRSCTQREAPETAAPCKSLIAVRPSPGQSARVSVKTFATAPAASRPSTQSQHATPLYTEGTAHAPATRAVSVGSHDAPAAGGSRDASRFKVSHSGAGAVTVPSAANERRIDQPANVAARNHDAVAQPAGAQPRCRQRADSDIRALFSDDHAAAASERARRGADHGPTALRPGDRNDRRTHPDRPSAGRARDGDTQRCGDGSGHPAQTAASHGLSPCPATD